MVCILALALGCRSALAQTWRPQGIDVSSYQGSADSPPTNINWTSVKGDTNIAFAWAKATEGLTYTDADFAYNETHAKSAGVPIGAYHFAHPDTHTGTSGADQEAAYFISVAGPYMNTNGGYLTPMLDAEVASPGTQAAVSAWVNEWCSYLNRWGGSNGFTLVPVVYTYQSWASSYLNSSVIEWPLWMASPNGQNPQTGAPSGTTPWSTWTLWQYGGGTIPGIEGTCDVDVFNGSITAMTNALMLGHQSAVPIAGLTNYWDPGLTKAKPGSGGTGTWDNSTANWWNSGTTNVVWSTAGDYAIFSGTAGTVTLGASVSANALTFSNAGYTIAGSSTLSLVSPGNVVALPGASNSITCVLGGVGLNLSGGGTLYLNNNGNFNSGETVTGPNTTLAVSSDHPTGNQNVTMTLKSGGIYLNLDATANDLYILPGCTVSLGSGGGIFENPNANLLMTNPISGSGSLTYIGTTRTLTLTNANTYTGGTIVQGGTLKASMAGTLGATTGALTVSGGTLDLGGASHTAGTVTISGGTISDGILTGSSYAGQSGTVSAQLAGSAALTKTTTNTLTLSGTNTYTGITTISSGLLAINADAKLGTAPGSPVANSLTINSGTTTNNYGLRTTASFALSSNRGITLGASGGQIQVAQNTTVTYGGVMTGSGAFEMGTAPTIGEGVLVLSGANNYTGGTTIACGTLRLGANGSLPSGTPMTIASAAIGGTFDMNGFSQTIGSLTSSPGIGGTGTQTPTILLTGPLTILQNSTTTFSGAIVSSGGSLTINGGGDLILNGTNTYTGNTAINAGALSLGATGSINNTAQISIAAGAAFDVSAIPSYTLGAGTTLSAGGNASQAILNGGTTVSLGSQPIILTYDGSDPALTIFQGTLSLNSNPFTINGPVLAPGTYTVIQQLTGNVAASGTFAVGGTAIGAGTTASIVVSGGNVNLAIQANAAFSNLTPGGSVNYGSGVVTLGGTVSAPGPIYPASGETVSVTINGNTQTTTINDSTGDFSINYNPSAIPASGAPYTISYAYAGNATLTPASNTGTSLSVNSLPVILTGTRPYNGTNDAAAAILSVSNKIGSDVVTVASGSAVLAGAGVGPQTITSVGTLALGGAAAGNYTLTGATGTVTITASTSTFSITGAAAVGGNFILTWQSMPGSNYQVIGSIDPTAALTNWTNIGSPITATDTNTSATNPITGAVGYFDVISQ